MQYRMHEGTLTLDDDWRDKGTNILVPADDSVVHPNIIVTRHPLEQGVTLADMVAQQRLILQKNLAGFTVINEGPMQLDGHEAQLLECTWEKEGSRMYQAAVCVLHDADRVLILSVSLPPQIATPSMRDKILGMVMSFRFTELSAGSEAAERDPA